MALSRGKQRESLPGSRAGASPRSGAEGAALPGCGTGSSSEDETERFVRSRLGQTLRGKYQLDHVLGVGGMAAVYAATHRNRKRFAVKVLHPGLSVDSSIRARFLREGYAANSVDHPGAVSVIDDDVAEDGSAFLVMELLQGQSVEELWAERGGRLPIPMVLAIGRQLLEVLSAAHARGIVHRDVKPANLFVTPGGAVKVLDFGIARLRDGSHHKITTTGTALGTPAFMAPEHVLGKDAEVGAQSDVWAVGATLFVLISGQLVHQGDTSQQLFVNAATQPARSLGSVSPDAPKSVVELIDRALSFDKAERWPTAADMCAALEQAHLEAFGRPVSSNPVAALTEADSQDARAPEAASGEAAREPAVAVAVGARPPPLPLSSDEFDAGELLEPLAPVPEEPDVVRSTHVEAAIPDRSARAAPRPEPRARMSARTFRTRAWARLRSASMKRIMILVAATLCGGGAVTAGVAMMQPQLPDPTFVAATGIEVLGEAPGLTLFLDGNEVGPLPQVLRDLVPGEEYHVSVEGGPRYRSFEQRVRIEPNRMVRIGPVKLKVLKGLVTIRASEAAEDIDVTLEVGDSRRVLPALPVRLEVETGLPHTLIARRVGHAPFTQPITFEDGHAERVIDVTFAGAPVEEQATVTKDRARLEVIADRASAMVSNAGTSANAEPRSDNPSGAEHREECQPPWYVDASGIQRLKPKCLDSLVAPSAETQETHPTNPGAARARARPSSPPPPNPDKSGSKDDCKEPYWVDESGMRRLKLNCL